MSEAKRALARRNDLRTSKEAAKSLDKGCLAKLELAVYNVIKATGKEGATLDDVCKAVGMDKVSVSPRLRPLCEGGFIQAELDSNNCVVTRLGNSGRRQTVWVAKR